MKNASTLLERIDNAQPHQLKQVRVVQGNVALLDEALAKWFDEKQSQGARLSDEVLLEKARELHSQIYSQDHVASLRQSSSGSELSKRSTFNFSTKWLWTWKRKNGISMHIEHGEARSADANAIANARVLFPVLLAESIVK